MSSLEDRLAPGRYECEVEKIGGEWLFKHRTVILERLHYPHASFETRLVGAPQDEASL